MTHIPNNDPLLDQIVTSLRQRGLHTAALTLLEAGQPLAFIGSQLLWLAQPALALLWPSSQVRQLAKFMEDPAAVTALRQHLAADEASL